MHYESVHQQPSVLKIQTSAMYVLRLTSSDLRYVCVEIERALLWIEDRRVAPQPCLRHSLQDPRDEVP